MPTPPSSRPSSRSSQFTPKTPRTVAQLHKQASSLRQLLQQRSKSPPSPSKTALAQLVKGCEIVMHSAALLSQENANLRAANEKKRRKRQRSTRQIPCEEELTVEEGRQLAQQLNQPVEGDKLGSHGQGELPDQAIPPPSRAPPRCSGCREIGHKINVCKNRFI
jgi:hypothetical protein